MRTVKIESDYSPGTTLQITQTDDGDVILKIRGNGEMRIATSGGNLRGNRLVSCLRGFSIIMDAIAGVMKTPTVTTSDDTSEAETEIVVHD